MNQGNGQNCWVVTLNNDAFVSMGLPWIYHARRFPGIKLFVADAGLEIQQRRKLLEEKIGILMAESRSHFDMWAGILNAKITEGTILYTSANDLLDPISIFDKGSDRMVFAQWPVQSEYYNLCKPLVSVVNQARTANYVEDRVANRLGGIASPTRLCGPAYWWKAMVGLTHFVRKSQPFHNDFAWEPLAVNLFAAAYPEYTALTA